MIIQASFNLNKEQLIFIVSSVLSEGRRIPPGARAFSTACRDWLYDRATGAHRTEGNRELWIFEATEIVENMLKASTIRRFDNDTI